MTNTDNSELITPGELYTFLKEKDLFETEGWFEFFEDEEREEERKKFCELLFKFPVEIQRELLYSCFFRPTTKYPNLPQGLRIDSGDMHSSLKEEENIIISQNTLKHFDFCVGIIKSAKSDEEICERMNELFGGKMRVIFGSNKATKEEWRFIYGVIDIPEDFEGIVVKRDGKWVR